MTELRICDAELFGVTGDGFTVCFCVEDGAGLVDAEARVLVDGEVRAASGDDGQLAPRLVRIEGLDPNTEYRIAIETGSGTRAPTDVYLPERVRTLPKPTGTEVATLATLGDLHFGEDRLDELPVDSGAARLVAQLDADQPYWRFMAEDALRDIEACEPDLVIVKGDVTDEGVAEQFRDARETLATLRTPHVAFLGNHDLLGGYRGEEVDGYTLLGQEPAPRSMEVAGWRLLLLDSTVRGHHHGAFGSARRAWLARALEESSDRGLPTLLFMHHQPVPREFAGGPIGSLGIRPVDSEALFDLVARHSEVRAVLVGHTHRNRVRRYAVSGAIPFIEVCATKDYPGAWAHYRLYDDGSLRQELRRASSVRALTHARRCSRLFAGDYRRYALGRLEDRSFAVT